MPNVWGVSSAGWARVCHGQDPDHPDMHSIFYAAGPALAVGRSLEPVHQVDLYNLMCWLLGLEPAPNDGEPSRIEGALPQPVAGSEP